MKLLLALALASGLLLCSARAEAPYDGAGRAAMLATFAEREAAVTALLATQPEAVDLLSERGDLRLFLGRPREAVADYQAMIERDPQLDVPHWRLGIALHLVGEFAKAADQFKKYHAYDARDRENGLWEYLSRARVTGHEQARTAMLSYHRFDREPFPSLYEVYAGRMEWSAFDSGLRERGVAGDRDVLFFAEYYAGLHHLLLGKVEEARRHLDQAVALGWRGRKTPGPGYMWQVARVQAEALAVEQEPR